jgi:cell division protein FtsL
VRADTARHVLAGGGRTKVGVMAKRKLSTNEKIFYVISLLIIISMVLSLIVGVFTPTNF